MSITARLTLRWGRRESRKQEGLEKQEGEGGAVSIVPTLECCITVGTARVASARQTTWTVLQAMELCVRAVELGIRRKIHVRWRGSALGHQWTHQCINRHSRYCK